jgi:hypothetical protein
MPADKRERFLKYQQHKTPSSSLSREYWYYAAQKMGMVDTDTGIAISEETQAAARNMLPFGTDKEYAENIRSAQLESLVDEFDQQRISPFMYMLMCLVQKCYLVETELVGKRKDAIAGLPGMACRLCHQRGRLGFCRAFPLNRRSLPAKVNAMYSHIMRCPLTPHSTKDLLRKRKQEADYDRTTFHFSERDREFIDKLWILLGCPQKTKS